MRNTFGEPVHAAELAVFDRKKLSLDAASAAGLPGRFETFRGGGLRASMATADQYGFLNTIEGLNEPSRLRLLRDERCAGLHQSGTYSSGSSRVHSFPRRPASRCGGHVLAPHRGSTRRSVHTPGCARHGSPKCPAETPASVGGDFGRAPGGGHCRSQRAKHPKSNQAGIYSRRTNSLALPSDELIARMSR